MRASSTPHSSYGASRATAGPGRISSIRSPSVDSASASEERRGSPSQTRARSTRAAPGGSSAPPPVKGAPPPGGGEFGGERSGGAAGVVRRDTAMFRRLLVPCFVYTEDSVVMGKDELIRAIRDGDRVDSASNANMIVHDHGGTAVVTGILRMKGKGPSGAFDRRYRFTDTWLRRDGTWRMIAAQDYLIPSLP